MATQYQLRIYNRAGIIQYIVTDFLSLSYVKEINGAGLLTFDLPAAHRAVADLDLDWQVEVWRRNAEQGVDWYCDYYGFWRGEERIANSDGRSVYRALCQAQIGILGRAIVGYKTNTSSRSLFVGTAAETIAKQLVQYNLTSSGTTADGRVRTVTKTGVTVAASGGTGTSMDLGCAWRNLLDVLRDVAAVGGGDFDLVKTAAASWEFNWYAGQLGTDRSASVVFALEYGNISAPKLTRSYLKERSVGIVGGQGTDSARVIEVRTGTNYAADYNDTETFIDARQLSTILGLQQYGDAELYDRRAFNDLTFEVLQVPQTLYGKHYFLGDLVTARYESVTAIKKVKKITVAMALEGNERIRVDLKDQG